MFESFRFFVNDSSQKPLKGSRLIRGDTVPLRVIVVEEEQDGATFRFVAKPRELHPTGVALITKVPADFTVTVQGNVLQADFVIAPIDTSVLTETIVLIYDLERTIDGAKKTLEQGTFTIVPDVAI